MQPDSHYSSNNTTSSSSTNNKPLVNDIQPNVPLVINAENYASLLPSSFHLSSLATIASRNPPIIQRATLSSQPFEGIAFGIPPVGYMQRKENQMTQSPPHCSPQLECNRTSIYTLRKGQQPVKQGDPQWQERTQQGVVVGVQYDTIKAPVKQNPQYESKHDIYELGSHLGSIFPPISTLPIYLAEKQTHSNDFLSYVLTKYHKASNQMRNNRLCHKIMDFLIKLYTMCAHHVSILIPSLGHQLSANSASDNINVCNHNSSIHHQHLPPSSSLQCGCPFDVTTAITDIQGYEIAPHRVFGQVDFVNNIAMNLVADIDLGTGATMMQPFLTENQTYEQASIATVDDMVHMIVDLLPPSQHQDNSVEAHAPQAYSLHQLSAIYNKLDHRYRPHFIYLMARYYHVRSYNATASQHASTPTNLDQTHYITPTSPSSLQTIYPQIFANCMFWFTGVSRFPLFILHLLVTSHGGEIIMAPHMISTATNPNTRMYIITEHVSAARFAQFEHIESVALKKRKREENALKAGVGGAHHPPLKMSGLQYGSILKHITKKPRNVDPTSEAQGENKPDEPPYLPSLPLGIVAPMSSTQASSSLAATAFTAPPPPQQSRPESIQRMPAPQSPPESVFLPRTSSLQWLGFNTVNQLFHETSPSLFAISSTLESPRGDDTTPHRHERPTNAQHVVHTESQPQVMHTQYENEQSSTSKSPSTEIPAPVPLRSQWMVRERFILDSVMMQCRLSETPYSILHSNG